MSSLKFVLALKDGTKVWINMHYIIKMIKDTDGNCFIILTNGDKYLIDYSHARLVENYLENGLI